MISALLSYTLYGLVTAITPGPNNVVSLYLMSQHGFKRSKLMYLGMLTGFYCVMLCCASFTVGFSKLLPSILKYLPYIGALYIAWLGISIMKSKPKEGHGYDPSFIKGFCLQFANVKIILYSLTVHSAYLIPKEIGFPHLFLNALYMVCLCSTGLITWGLAGGLLHSWLQKYYRPFNFVMGIILFYCAFDLIRPSLGL